jgi:hypothetical protein
MELSFPCQSGYEPNQRIHTVVMATDAEIREFLEEICEVSETVEDDLSVFKHSDDSPKPCQLVCTEPFNGMPNEIIKTFVI